MAESDWATYYGKSGPRCPNHRVHLVDCNYKDGWGICPISGARFTFDHEEYEKTKKLKINALGEMEEQGEWKVQGHEGEE